MEKLIELVQYTNEKEKSAKKIEANMKKEKISKR